MQIVVNKKYRCINTIRANVKIYKDSIWTVEKIKQNVIDIFCDDKSANDGYYIGINRDRFYKNFEEVQE